MGPTDIEYVVTIWSALKDAEYAGFTGTYSVLQEMLDDVSIQEPTTVSSSVPSIFLETSTPPVATDY